MASIKKNKNGTYSATVYVGRDANEKMIRKFVTRDGLKECKAAVRELEQEIEDNDISNVANMKMSAYMDKWIELNKSNLASTTIKCYNTYINTHFKPYFGHMKVDKITDMQIKQYITDKSKDLSSCTVRKHYFTLSKMMYDALRSKSPCIDIKAPKNSEYKPVVPNEKEFKLIWDTFKEMSLEDELIILLAGWCGLRRGEIFALKQDDIDQEAGTIRVDEAVALNEDNYKFDFKAPKSENGIRTIAAPDYLMKLIETVLINRTKDTKTINPSLTTYNPHSFTKKYFKIINAEGSNLPKTRFHDLRHYHATLLYKNNVPDHYAAERLGHDIMVLKKIYQHLGIEVKKEYDDKIRSIFDKK
jgi:integrase